MSWTFQAVPFQDSASGRAGPEGPGLAAPTAAHRVAEVQETDTSLLNFAGLGVAVIVQAMPFQRAASVASVVPAAFS